jgi:hypothetical protein
MITVPKLKFRGWVPAAAREKILELSQREDLTPDRLAVLYRLATRDLMRTGVWQKLPPSAAGMEGQIIEWIVLGLELAAAAQPLPPPRRKGTTKSEYYQKLHRYYTKKVPRIFTAQDAAYRARWLLNAMDAIRGNAETVWDEQTLSYAAARNVVERLEQFFERLEEIYQAVATDLKLPRIRKKRAANFKELYLSQFLSQRFIDRFNKPNNAIVGGLVAVALDLDPGPDATTIRKRRRGEH